MFITLHHYSNCLEVTNVVIVLNWILYKLLDANEIHLPSKSISSSKMLCIEREMSVSIKNVRVRLQNRVVESVFVLLHVPLKYSWTRRLVREETPHTHNNLCMHIYTVMTLFRQIHLMSGFSNCCFYLSLVIVNMDNSDINIWAFEPWKLIIYEGINKVPVMLKTAWKSNKTDLMLLQFLLTSSNLFKLEEALRLNKYRTKHRWEF